MIGSDSPTWLSLPGLSLLAEVYSRQQAITKVLFLSTHEESYGVRTALHSSFQSSLQLLTGEERLWSSFSVRNFL